LDRQNPKQIGRSFVCTQNSGRSYGQENYLLSGACCRFADGYFACADSYLKRGTCQHRLAVRSLPKNRKSFWPVFEALRLQRGGF